MTILNFISLAGGLGFFLYGMNIMGSGLEKLAGSKLEIILRKVTNNPIKAVIFGALLTAAIQSSSATTVIVVGLVNSSIMKLDQAIGIIMGANIGTTVTAQILRLSDLQSDNIFLQLLKPTTLAPLFAIIGAVLFVFLKNPKLRNVGQILLGFGILFSGMFAMEAAVAPLHESELFFKLFATMQNPVVGVLVGAIVTGIIQSSAASISILQALTSTGVITWASSIPIILGQNIGTCVTPMIASVGASKGAKRSAIAHLYFNIIGTIIFLTVIYGCHAIFEQTGAFAGFFQNWTSPITRGDIANFHTLFNVIVTILFLPFTKLLAKLAEITIRGKKGEESEEPDIPVLDERLLASPAVALQQARSAVGAMSYNADKNYKQALDLLFNYNAEQLTRIEETESIIDRLEVSVSNYLVKLSECELNENESHSVSELLNFVTEFERIGDYVVNVVERSGEVKDKNIVFSDSAKKELVLLDKAINEILELTHRSFVYSDIKTALHIEPLEEVIDMMCDTLRSKHIKRLKNGQCNIESGIVFLEILTNLERISDHCSNVAAHIVGNEYSVDDDLDVHELRKKMHDGNFENYTDLNELYKEKFYVPLA